MDSRVSVSSDYDFVEDNINSDTHTKNNFCYVSLLWQGATKKVCYVNITKIDGQKIV